ncbi:MAG TPA: (2Fe-2S) ferredoxin domain-containing protein [Polyangiaceae bacterium]|nr:(2Fe-2S) ferredoxin domain-containing protein [Polyangiaceae bacterium]
MLTKKHVFVCVQNRPAGHPRGSCQSKGSPSLYQAFSDEFTRRALWNDYRLTLTNCLGPCENGPSVLVYPEGVLYGHVGAEDVAPIVDQHLIAGSPVERLAVADW